MIDWTNPDCLVTPHFTVKDCILFHVWNRLATIADGLDDAMKANLVALCNKMEEVRTLLGCPINVHCMFRSILYNRAMKIMLPTGKDVHSFGQACDFDCGDKLTIQQVKDLLVPKLAELNIRLEKGTTTWIHVDQHAVGPSGRYFTP